MAGAPKPSKSSASAGKATVSDSTGEKRRVRSSTPPPTSHSSLPVEHRTEAPLTRRNFFSLRKQVRSALVALEKNRPKQVHQIPLNPRIYFSKPAQLKAHADSLKIISHQLEKLNEMRQFLRGEVSINDAAARKGLLRLLKLKPEELDALKGTLLPRLGSRFEEELARLNKMVDRLNKGLPAIEPALPKPPAA